MRGDPEYVLVDARSHEELVAGDLEEVVEYLELKTGGLGGEA